MDRILFDQGFNGCDMTASASVMDDDLEFYHDESGTTFGKENFISGFRDGVCALDYKATRRLVNDSLVVYRLKNNGEVYGALQMGEHQFYAQYGAYGDGPPVLTSTARFTHLWLLQGGAWKLTRVFSFGHYSPEEMN